MASIDDIKNKLRDLANQETAKNYKRYLKSPFEFYGLKTPELRKIAKQFKNIQLTQVYELFNLLWNSNFHEEKSIAIFILAEKKKQLDFESWKFVLSKVKDIKTWDHCDALSSWLLGVMLAKDISLKRDIENFACSKNLWERRAAIVSTIQLIRKGKLDLTFKLAEKLIYDEDIYVQKGAGWMLREAGKKERMAVRNFILMHLDMKATAFSYATEKMKELRQIRKEKQKEEGSRKD